MNGIQEFISPWTSWWLERSEGEGCCQGRWQGLRLMRLGEWQCHSSKQGMRNRIRLGIVGWSESWVYFNCVEIQEPRKTQSFAKRKNKSDSILALFYCLGLVKLVLHFCKKKKKLSTAWNKQDSLFSGLWPLRVHSYRDKKFQNKEWHLFCWRCIGTLWSDQCG